MSSVNSIGSNTNSTAADQPVMPQQTLGQADFLKLLVTQMTSQDPLNPQSGTDFVAQLAQFSSLSASQAMEGTMNSLQASDLLGRTVTVNSTDGSQTTGLVSAVQLQGGTPQIVVGGQSYDLSQIQSISPAPAATSTTN
ncbi:MAG TPA: flagellar hook capping FlgD N-terminal domain-containing protein [Verrucomicrobiae bacterium]|nr:flagellar hook capping FlgD N-terminal domain-containing protein [Verrucomicrobiae bacterium]